MTLQEYINSLNAFAMENPEALSMIVIASSDDEGNNFSPIHYSPSKGIFEDRDFIPASQLEDWDREENEINAVCIN